MSKKQYLFYALSGLLIGLFIVPLILPFSLSDIIAAIVGEPTIVSHTILICIAITLVYLLFSPLFHKNESKPPV
ncbi:hypothetical protein M3210_19165 [Oceanobacillus luteolus]|uniref:Uncharacterized protein n=1 Tax=Oceanobacillus luteolus TaxID=1274358 RepID=A0ABW4HNV9_9BACI|nr:hypothetical protein [Oceanobacillus luteolus]MCM3742340.1 hypothetical protein [Oceanobacillus luteolus]